MPRYFFHIEDGQSLPDPTGTELPGLEQARRQALSLASALMGEHTPIFWNTGEWKMRVTDERDLTLFELVFYVNEAAGSNSP